MRCDICIPVLNESLILEQSTKKVLEFCKTNLDNLDWQIILVINGSTDDSEKISIELTKFDSRIKNFVYNQKGRGQALRKYWQQSQADIFCYMDCDLAVELEALPRLLKPLIDQRADLVIGNRYNKGSVIKRSLFRELSSRIYNFMAYLIIKHPQPDLQCGFKALTKKVFDQLAIYATDNGWFFDTELILWANKLGLIVESIPINWEETRLGKRQSTVKIISTTINFIKNLLLLRKRLNNTIK